MPCNKLYLFAAALLIALFFGLPAMTHTNIGGMYLGNFSEPNGGAL
jgi:hypothetical protein